MIIYSCVPTIYLIYFSDYIVVYFFSVSEKVLPPYLVCMVLGHVSHPEDGGSTLFRNVGALIYYTAHETKGLSTGQQPSCMPENLT